MEIFLDTANVDEIKEAVDWGVISGVTTNPTLTCPATRSPVRMSKRRICEGET